MHNCKTKEILFILQQLKVIKNKDNNQFKLEWINRIYSINNQIKPKCIANCNIISKNFRNSNLDMI
jgi:hypothetical protein